MVYSKQNFRQWLLFYDLPADDHGNITSGLAFVTSISLASLIRIFGEF